MPAYTRYWDLHLTGQGGYYEFTSLIQEQLEYQMTAPGDAGKPTRFTRSVNLVIPPNLDTPGVIQNAALGAVTIPNECFVVSMLDLNKLANTPTYTDPDLRKLVTWINDPAGVGKLRINCHGDGMGQLGMGDKPNVLSTLFGRPKMTWVAAGHLIDLLVANGLVATGGPTSPSLAGPKLDNGLITINLAICMGGRFGATPATADPAAPNSRPAPRSAVSQILTRLRNSHIHGIEVTGSNEITMMSNPGHNGQLGRTLGVGMNQLPGGWDLDPGPAITVPAPFNVNPAGTIDIPVGWTVDAGPSNPSRQPSRGWILAPGPGQPPLNSFIFPGGKCEVFAGWIVDATARLIHPPRGWVTTSAGPNAGGQLKPDAATSGEFVMLWERLAHSAAKVREIS